MDIKPEDIYTLEERILVDIRSPSEYEEFHIPGAINIPIFEDEEKRLIGLVYRREGVEKAKELGYEIAWEKLQSLLERFRNLKRDYKNVVVYCWRGGLRSQELCRVLRSMGIEVLRLEGGYRAYREFILRDMERLLEGKTFLVLTGKTGVGKTRLLRRLKEEGYPVIDLEALAQHRGAVFGRVGIKKRISQKMFDALLYEELKRINSDLLIVEDESRVIGNIHIPDSLWNKKEQGFFLEIETSLERRLKNIIEEYTAFEGWQEEVKSSIGKIRKYLGEEKYKNAISMLEEGRIEDLALFLMTEYYDKAYKLNKSAFLKLYCSNEEECLSKIKEVYSSLLKEGVISKLGG